jgi:hypothetical protein
MLTGMAVYGAKSLEEAIAEYNETCYMIDQWAPDFWAKSGCHDFYDRVRTAYEEAVEKAAQQQAVPKAPVAANRSNFDSTELFDVWTTIDDPQPGFLVHILNKTDRRIRCKLSVWYTEQSTNGAQIHERAQKDKRTIHIQPGATEYWGYGAGQEADRFYPRFDRYSLTCKQS